MAGHCSWDWLSNGTAWADLCRIHNRHQRAKSVQLLFARQDWRFHDPAVNHPGAARPPTCPPRARARAQRPFHVALWHGAGTHMADTSACCLMLELPARAAALPQRLALKLTLSHTHNSNRLEPTRSAQLLSTPPLTSRPSPHARPPSRHPRPHAESLPDRSATSAHAAPSGRRVCDGRSCRGARPRCPCVHARRLSPPPLQRALIGASTPSPLACRAPVLHS